MQNKFKFILLFIYLQYSPTLNNKKISIQIFLIKKMYLYKKYLYKKIRKIVVFRLFIYIYPLKDHKRFLNCLSL